MSALVLVPSYHRAGATTVRRVFTDATLAVIESEADEYREREGGEIVVMPEEVGGNISRTRNWILDYGFQRSERVVMVDDDLTIFGRHEWNWQRSQYDAVHYDYGRVLDFIENGFEMAEDLGIHLWGVNMQSGPQSYLGYAPFSLVLPVLGPFTCVTKSALRYDARLRLNEDYDYFLQHMQRYRRVLRFNSHFYVCDHLRKPGGVTSYRTLDEERRQAETMVRKWGPEIVKYNFERSTNPRVRAPIPGC